MEQRPSKKHHFLPRHYLKGFTNADGIFYIYDKLNDKIFSTNPDAAFFENNLNTITHKNGETSDFLEDLYTHSENTAWGAFDRIRQSTVDKPIEILDKMNLFFFMLFLHWRLPSNIKHVEELSKNFFNGTKELNYFSLKNKNGEPVPQEIIDAIRNSSTFKKSSKLMLPFAPFREPHWQDKLNNWRFLYTRSNESWYLVGDNPIITDGIFDHDPVKCLDKFVFPVAGNVLLVNTPNPLIRGIDGGFIIQYGIAVIEKAARFVACPNEAFLKALVEHHKIYKGDGKNGIIIGGMFEMLRKVQ